jgi:hypothetical protein
MKHHREPKKQSDFTFSDANKSKTRLTAGWSNCELDVLGV